MAAAIALTALVALTGCGSDGVLTLGADEATRSPCPSPTTIPVEQLRTSAAPTCVPAGSDLLFPNGTRVTIDDQAGSGGLQSTSDPVRYSWIDVGNFGVVAGQATTSCARHHVWGSIEGVRRVRQAFGPDWPCPARD
ncbi:hypothetical protein [Curtobacterium sp. VKM Ac-2922]|uniref:hypothetical protein n=1 Tax=Curtobacterium sp. VKM Ac-2922 TaxID=2929475 RepID=UPI001FB4FE08|nr:hypothetical protein [Curtobacterium sp. VKM Ac-2922]MCJ1715235.1 hypothetical protein [Curtobacterium sp. VKM Ac-2922]